VDAWGCAPFDGSKFSAISGSYFGAIQHNDISAAHPELVQELFAVWDEFAHEHGVVRDNRISNFERWTTGP
jgi:hypothetical protein